MGREKKPGFVFSLDAFVAFSLILIAIQSLLVISSTPRGYYRGLNQADYLATDTLQTLTVAQDPASPSQSYLDEASGDIVLAHHFTTGSSTTGPLLTATDRLIPKPYSYAFLFYNTSNRTWYTLYNASSDSPTDNIHHDVPFHRVQAAAQMLVMGYSDPLVAGQSPYCNVVCKGWSRLNNGGLGGNIPQSNSAACIQVPCNVSINSTYDTGDFNVGVLRLVVWG